MWQGETEEMQNMADEGQNNNTNGHQNSSLPPEKRLITEIA